MKIFLPTDDPEFKIVHDPKRNKWRANKVILGTKYSLNDIATFERFDLSITNYSINSASANGHVNILQWWLEQWFESGSILKWDDHAMNLASANGHVNVLQWWLKSGLELKYDYHAMNGASANGHVDVLQWWLKSKLKLNYNEESINVAFAKGHVDVIHWWLKCGLKDCKL